MESIPAPKTLKIYQLLRQSGMSFTNAGTISSGMSTGFYLTQQEAEHNRTMEVLKDTTSGSAKPIFHVFELEIPNPAYKNDL